MNIKDMITSERFDENGCVVERKLKCFCHIPEQCHYLIAKDPQDNQKTIKTELCQLCAIKKLGDWGFKPDLFTYEFNGEVFADLTKDEVRSGTFKQTVAYCRWRFDLYVFDKTKMDQSLQKARNVFTNKNDNFYTFVDALTLKKCSYSTEIYENVLALGVLFSSGVHDRIYKNIDTKQINNITFQDLRKEALYHLQKQLKY